MEIFGIVIIFASLVSILVSVTPKNPLPRPTTTKTLTTKEEKTILKQVVSGPRSSDLVIYWVDTLELLTYAERKNIEQAGRIISLTPHEVLIEDPDSNRKLAVRRMGDPAAPSH